MLKGIDVSQHQGRINWDVVKGNIDYAILRLGWTGNKNNHTVDTQFERNYAECKRLGIPVGVYIYNYCNSIEKVKSGANWTIEKLKGKTLELPVYLDMEDSTIRGLNKTILTNMCIEFNSIIEKAGFWAGVYANKDWFNNYLHKDILGSRYTCWVAQYSSSCTLTIQNKDMWQYSDCGKLAGITGKVDMNYLYRDLLGEIRWTNISINNKKSIEEIAKEVIAGQWSNGDNRKNNLISAGYNYDEVQSKVNELLGQDQYYQACSSNFVSLVEALKSIGVDSSYDSRKRIAVKNGIKDYTGTAVQNTRLLDKLKSGRLLKV